MPRAAKLLTSRDLVLSADDRTRIDAIGRVRTKRTVADRFWRHVIKNENGCWGWSGSLASNGYAEIRINKMFGNARASRVSWLLHFGDFDKSLCICHKCDNPSCTNPDHLFLGTHAENMQDMIGKGRHRKSMLQGKLESIQKLRSQGFLFREIGEKLGCSEATVRFALQGKLKSCR